jgi:hypothetical protein
LRLTNVEIAGDVLLNVGFTSLGYVSLWGTKIGRDLDCSTATFIGPSPVASGRSMAGAMVATNLAVAGDMKLIDVTVLGRIDCENLQTGGSLIWDGLRFPREITAGGARHGYRTGVDALPRMLLSHARIGAALVACDLTAEVALAIDLGGARAATLDDAGFPIGWGVGRAREGLFCTLNLDGFVYDRFSHLPSDDASGLAVALSALGRWVAHFDQGHSASWAVRLARRMQSAQRAHVRQRLAWVQRQQSGGSEFHPQPYRHLAKVLRAQGHYQAAREVAIVEQWTTPSANRVTRLLRSVWGVCFGFGLSPLRATATVVALLAIGTGGVWWAWKQADVLVINYSYAMTEVADSPVFLRPEGAQGTAGAPPCGDNDIQPLFYAMDMMVPVMALHQMDKCWVDTKPGTEGWRAFWSVFSFVGKLVTSLALLTYSGVLKPKEEG